MPDVFTVTKRSEVMAAIRSRGNRSTELRLMDIFREMRIKGWRRNSPLIGKPDFVFPTLRVAVFVHGCFWHQCPIHGRIPKGNQVYWATKLACNHSRDREVSSSLRKRGWRVLILWEHDLTKLKRPILSRRLKLILNQRAENTAIKQPRVRQAA